MRVARLRQGDPVSVINGQGDEIRGLLSVSGKQNVYVEVREQAACPPPPVALTLALGGLHQEKALQEVIRRAVETGFSRICFWQAEHSQKPVAVHDKCFKTALETCKQCGRFFLPIVDTAPSLQAFLESYDGPSLIALLAEDIPGGQYVVPKKNLALIVGPEGDFSEQERDVALEAGAVPVSLGANTYRSEVAAALLLTVVAHTLGELGPGLPLDLPPSS